MALVASAACHHGMVSGLGAPKHSFVSGVLVPSTARLVSAQGGYTCNGAGDPIPAIFVLPPGVTMAALTRWYDDKPSRRAKRWSTPGQPIARRATGPASAAALVVRSGRRRHKP